MPSVFWKSLVTTAQWQIAGTTWPVIPSLRVVHSHQVQRLRTSVDDVRHQADPMSTVPWLGRNFH